MSLKVNTIIHSLNLFTVITGCTDGIGRAYLEELVSTRNIKKLYLIGRNSTKLAVLAKHFGKIIEIKN